jgi:hypothetical protein
MKWSSDQRLCTTFREITVFPVSPWTNEDVAELLLAILSSEGQWSQVHIAHHTVADAQHKWKRLMSHPPEWFRSFLLTRSSDVGSLLTSVME